MANTAQPQHRTGLPRYYHPPRPVVDPAPYIAQQAAREQANILARKQAAQALADQKIEEQKSKIEAQAKAQQLSEAARAANLITQTNSAWNLSQSKAAEAAKKPTIKFVDKSNLQGETTYNFTPDELKRFIAQKEAGKNSPELEKLKAERASHAQNILEGDKRFGFLNWNSRPARVAELDSKISALQPPTDLLKTNDMTAPAAPVVKPPPTPSGFIGSPGRNTFLDLSNPEIAKATEGMNREQMNAYAINRNNQGAAPANLLRSDSFPLGYDPAHGSFQMQPEPQTERGVPVEQPAPVAASPQDLLSAPNFRPAMGDLRAGEGNIVAPVKADAKPRIPQSHIDHLIKNPDAAKEFNAKYGEGTAEEILNR